MTNNIKILFTAGLLFAATPLVIAQTSTDYEPSEERSSFEQRKISIMDANQLRATYHNTGHAGRRDANALNELLFEYPRNSGREYMYFMSVMYGTEVPNQNPLNATEEFPLVTVASYRTSRTGDVNWSLNPIAGYARDDAEEMARSDRGPTSPLGNTWPDLWPDKLIDGGDGWAGSWNGFFGRDQFNADIEFYYRATDDTYSRFLNPVDDDLQYVPDDTDPTRGGLAIIFDARILAWTQLLVQDTHFNIFEIRNDGSYDYQRMAFGLWIADFVAGGGSTDTPLFDNIQAIAYLTDENRNSGNAAFDGELIGEMGLKFLETPGNAQDGIDNDGDSDTYDPISQFRDMENADLYTSLTIDGNGFYRRSELVDTLIPSFTAADFDEREIQVGEKYVRILEDGSRVIELYDGTPFVSQGVTWDFGGATISVTEDALPGLEIHLDGLDSDFDGLIDENAPNHLTKNFFDPGTGTFTPRPVRFINYLAFEVGDTLSQGLIVPNKAIRNRISTDASFAELVTVNHSGRLQNIHTSAPMMDEGREDFFDNDNDWDPTTDDVGIQGDPESPSTGQGDGFPSTGAGTSFPGEPSIDKTDVSETDLIGVSRVTIFDAGALQVNQDAEIWDEYLTPNEFVEDQGTDSDIFVSSGLFPLLRGATERFAVAITASQEDNDDPLFDRERVNEKLTNATRAYEADYQFAVAPDPPNLVAVPGDGKVTLYWDEVAEESFDRYLNIQTGNGNDFEGYKIYRTTDVSFEEIRTITDGNGSAVYFSPIEVFDLRNGIRGFHPVSNNGLQFNLGDDSGLKRVFVDENVVNGRKYYYAVSSYDRGFASAGISPSESPIQISLNPDGSVSLGRNVVEVRPTRDQAGYISPETPLADLVSGSPGGTVSVEIIDPRALLPDNLYDVVFEDTVISGGSNPDTLRTNNFTLRNITGSTPDTLISRSPNFDGQNNEIVEGFTLFLNNIPEFGLNEDLSGWSSSTGVTQHNYEYLQIGPPKIADYEIIIGDNVGFGQSTEKNVEVSPGIFLDLPSIATNFKVFNTYDGEEIDFAFLDLNEPTSVQQRCNPTFIVPDNYEVPVPGQLSAVSGSLGRCSDIIYFIEDYEGVVDTLTVQISMAAVFSADLGAILTTHPQPGDTLGIFTTKPFSSNDRFQFLFDTDNIPRIDADTARSELDDILVIPNPYKVSSIYESQGTASNRQQNRELHFTGIPAPSTLRIFTVSGVLIREIEITESDLTSQYGGSYIWDMLTKDNLEIAYGIYLYQIEAPGVGEKVGKFAVIK